MSRDGNSQHRGIGKFLMTVAETISCLYECTLATVISGVGVRLYYRHIGYTLDTNEDQFMIKNLDIPTSLVLFGKEYDIQEIKKTIYNSTISQKYITIDSESESDSDSENKYIYTDIQNGEAEGFVFSGNKVKNKVFTTRLSIFNIFLIVLFYITTFNTLIQN